MAKPPIQAEPIQNILEVVEYEQTKTALHQFLQQNQTVFDSYQQLVEMYNTALEAANKAVRAQSVSCGDFDLYQRNDKVDAEALHTAVSREDFLSMGGSVTMTRKVKVDKLRFLTKHAQGEVTDELFNSVVSYEDKYHTPDKLVGP